MSTGTALAATSRREDPGVLIRRAKKLYDAARTTDGDSSKKLSAALHLFKVASILCPCNNVLYTSSKQIGLSTKDIPLPNCHCKVYLDLAATNVNDGDREKLAIYELATKPCACGSGIATCRSAVHIEALDGTIAVAEAQKDYIKAIQYTSLLITMAPHAPEGYLRLVKILRLQSLSSRPTVKVDNQCAYILSQGCWTVRSFGDKEHEKVKIIERLIRKDIVRCLPPELQVMALKHLSMTDLNRAMRVSKAWYLASRAPSLWKDLRFEKRWPSTRARPFRPGVLNDIVINRAQGTARNLIVTDTESFGIDDNKLRAILRGLPKLEGLSLAGRSLAPTKENVPLQPNNACLNFSKIFTVICEQAPPSLKVLRLSYFGYNPASGTPWSTTSAIARISSSLEELSFSLIDEYPQVGRSSSVLSTTTVEAVAWPMLKSLTIVGKLDYGPKICLPKIAINTPSLKELVVGGFMSWTPGLLVSSHHGLERLALTKTFVGPPPLATTTLRSLELGTDALIAWEKMWEFSNASTVVLDKLEHLCFRCCSNVGAMGAPPRFSPIQPSCNNGTLRSLHITFDRNIRDALDLVLNKPAIHTLSCHSIGLGTGDDSYYLNEEVDLYLDWVDTFPGLHTIGVYPVKTEKAWTVVAKLMKRRPDIQTIYTDVLIGVYRDEVLKRAAKNGIAIVEATRVPSPALPVAPIPGPVLMPVLEPRIISEHQWEENQGYSDD